jgi:malate dehydrogenase (oxaloacetate-decarboxylating)(NADP+)
VIRKQDSLDYHAMDRPGKISVNATKSCLTPRELRMAYLPGATHPSLEISEDPSSVYKYTIKGNLVAAVTDGSSIPGLGDLGPLAAKPMQEGIAILFKRLADIDVYDLELDSASVDDFVKTVCMLEPTFGGINLKDIKAPRGLEIYDRLREKMEIPIYHENLYSTAVVAVAALINALELVDKKIEDVRIVLSGAGTVGIGCARLLRRLGVGRDNMLMYDIDGLVHPDVKGLNAYQQDFAVDSPLDTMAKGLEDADVFIGVSAGDVLNQEMIRSMAQFPIVFALATPVPEIGYEEAKAARQDVIVATGLGQFPNAVLDVLSFPYIFRGALDVQSTSITEGMLLAAARALADLAREDVPEEVERAYGGQRFSFGPDYLLPKSIDPRIFIHESAAVAEQAVTEGVAKLATEKADYRESLSVRIGTGREKLRDLTMTARGQKARVVMPEGCNDTLIRACSILMDEEIIDPILLGSEKKIRDHIDRLGLDMGGATIIDVERSHHLEEYVDAYFKMRHRSGVIRDSALERMHQHDYFAAMMLHSGHADMMVAGLSTHFTQTLQTILEVIGPAPDISRISSHYLLMMPKEVVIMADCAVNIDPTAEQLAEIALLAATMSRSLGVEPRVAMLSFSNFGSADHAFVDKVQEATRIVKARAPELMVDGEMQLGIARDQDLRDMYFPFSSLTRDANVLVFPDLQSGNLAMQSLNYMAKALPVGPMLMGTRLPVHLLQYGATVEEVVNLTTVGVVEMRAQQANRIGI